MSCDLKIVSGGQTGVDRAALDVAIALGIPHGGWCPSGRWAEDGPLSDRYHLTETGSADPAQRTRRNVQNSDATLVICDEPLEGGTRLTARFARKIAHPLLIVSPGSPAAPDEIRSWLTANAVSVLNVAGPRESRAPGIYGQAFDLLSAALGQARNHVPGP